MSQVGPGLSRCNLSGLYVKESEPPENANGKKSKRPDSASGTSVRMPVLQCVAVCYSVLRCVAVRCSVL